MRHKWQRRIEKRRPSSESESEDEVLYKDTDKTAHANISRNSSNRAEQWEKQFQERAKRATIDHLFWAYCLQRPHFF